MGKAKRVVVGMSGGVDSSVTAWLLKQQGYEVIGVTMQIWQEQDEETLEREGGCCGLSAVEDARRVASALGIPYYVMNFRREFQTSVIDYFIKEYQTGRTPNPCIACNRYVKWESLLQRSLEIGADYIATGHYARVVQLPSGRFTLKCSAAVGKDQTYALYNLTQEQLARTLMPLGEYRKDQVRAMAADLGLQVADKPDSQEICFVPDQDYGGFIERQSGQNCQPGDFVDLEGRVIGQHRGIIHYTIGQRKGLGLALGHPVFVVGIDPGKNQVIIGEGADVWTTRLEADRLNFMAVEDLPEPRHLLGKIRYNHEGSMCWVSKTGPDRLECVFDEPVRAVTPGQALVLYDGTQVIGGGTIR